MGNDDGKTPELIWWDPARPGAELSVVKIRDMMVVMKSTLAVSCGRSWAWKVMAELERRANIRIEEELIALNYSTLCGVEPSYFTIDDVPLCNADLERNREKPWRPTVAKHPLLELDKQLKENNDAASDH